MPLSVYRISQPHHHVEPRQRERHVQRLHELRDEELGETGLALDIPRPGEAEDEEPNQELAKVGDRDVERPSIQVEPPRAEEHRYQDQPIYLLESPAGERVRVQSDVGEDDGIPEDTEVGEVDGLKDDAGDPVEDRDGEDGALQTPLIEGDHDEDFQHGRAPDEGAVDEAAWDALDYDLGVWGFEGEVGCQGEEGEEEGWP